MGDFWGTVIFQAYLITSTIDNVVVTDLLPAGFDIENPRTKEIPGLDRIKDAATPQTLDMQDDRINFSRTL